MKVTSYLIVDRGNPFEEGNIISLKKSMSILGRKGAQWAPDISFDNVFVSRKHAAVYFKNGNYFIKDLNSKHGTFINDHQLQPNKSSILKHTDKISIANEQVVLSFSFSEIEETLDITPFVSQIEQSYSKSVMYDAIKQEIVVQNQRYTFSEKEYRCMVYLLQKIDQFVSKEELKECVWAERSHSLNIFPDVSSEEINALIYRIRKKTNQTINIENIRGKGYILSLNTM